MEAGQQKWNWPPILWFSSLWTYWSCSLNPSVIPRLLSSWSEECFEIGYVRMDAQLSAALFLSIVLCNVLCMQFFLLFATRPTVTPFAIMAVVPACSSGRSTGGRYRRGSMGMWGGWPYLLTQICPGPTKYPQHDEVTRPVCSLTKRKLACASPTEI